MRTLYISGWCVSACGKQIRAIRARIGRRKFLGNYGIERKDVGAASERVGFAIAVPLPRGKSHVTVEVQESDGVWRAISSRAVFGVPNGDSVAPIDPKYFIPNPGANPRIEFWLDRPLVWPNKARQLKVSSPVACSAASSVTPMTCNFACSSVVERADQTFLYSERPGCCSIRRYLACDSDASIAVLRCRRGIVKTMSDARTSASSPRAQRTMLRFYDIHRIFACQIRLFLIHSYPWAGFGRERGLVFAWPSRSRLSQRPTYQRKARHLRPLLQPHLHRS